MHLPPWLWCARGSPQHDAAVGKALLASICAPSCRAQLERKVLQVLEARKTANSLTSGAQCQDIEALCEDDLERQQHASLPSLGRFTARYKRV